MIWFLGLLCVLFGIAGLVYREPKCLSAAFGFAMLSLAPMASLPVAAALMATCAAMAVFMVALDRKPVRSLRRFHLAACRPYSHTPASEDRG